MTEADGKLLLSPYRVLDLTDERGLLCGKILADLGADVIQIEPPGGSTARHIGPFYKGDVQPEKSLFWWAYAVNKRGITLNLERPDGRQLLKRLLQDADFLIESFAPGYLSNLGLGYTALKAVNPCPGDGLHYTIRSNRTVRPLPGNRRHRHGDERVDESDRRSGPPAGAHWLPTVLLAWSGGRRHWRHAGPHRTRPHRGGAARGCIVPTGSRPLPRPCTAILAIGEPDSAAPGSLPAKCR